MLSLDLYFSPSWESMTLGRVSLDHSNTTFPQEKTTAINETFNRTNILFPEKDMIIYFNRWEECY